MPRHPGLITGLHQKTLHGLFRCGGGGGNGGNDPEPGNSESRLRPCVGADGRDGFRYARGREATLRRAWPNSSQ